MSDSKSWIGKTDLEALDELKDHLPYTEQMDIIGDAYAEIEESREEVGRLNLKLMDTVLLFDVITGPGKRHLSYSNGWIRVDMGPGLGGFSWEDGTEIPDNARQRLLEISSKN